MKKLKKQIKYPNGGLKKAGEFFGNYGNALADTSLSAIGLNNVIPDSAYQGYGADTFQKTSQVVGGIEKMALPLALSAVGVPPQLTKTAQAGISQFNPQDPNKQNFPFGGMPMGQPQDHLEKKETFQLPSGQFGQVDAGTHASGMDANMGQLPGGTRIFSDRLKSKSEKTFAEESAKLKVDKWQKILDNKSSDSFSRNTAKRMLEITDKKLDGLFQEQETFKQENGINDDGSKHSSGGTIHIKPENRGKFTAYKERIGKTTEEALHSSDAHVRKMAQFAKNASHWNHPNGGVLPTKSDSLNLYNNAKELNSYFNNNADYRLDNTTKVNPEAFNKDQMNSRNYFQPLMSYTTTENNNIPMTYDQYYKPVNQNQYYQREVANKKINRNAPMGLYDKRISPQYEKTYTNINGNTSIGGDIATVPQYDPLAVKPWSMLTAKEQSRRVKKYGVSGTPFKSVNDFVPQDNTTPDPRSQNPVTPQKPAYYGTQINNGVPQPINSTIQPMQNIDQTTDLTSRLQARQKPVAAQPISQTPIKPMIVGNIPIYNGNTQAQTTGKPVLPAYLQGPNITQAQRDAYYATLPHSNGGVIKRNYGGGGTSGPTDNPFVANPDYNQFSFDPYSDMRKFTTPDLTSDINFYNQPTQATTGSPETSTPYTGQIYSMNGVSNPPVNNNNVFTNENPSSIGKSAPTKTPFWDSIKDKYSKVNPGFTAASAGNFLGGAYDIYRGLKGPDKVDYQRVNPSLVDYSQSRDLTTKQTNQSFRDTRKAIQEGTNGNSGNYLANIGNAAANRDELIRNNNTTSIENQQNNNSAIKNTASSTNAQIQMAESNARQQEKDQSKNITSIGLYNTGKALTQLGTDTQMKAYDPVIRNLISTGDYKYEYSSKGIPTGIIYIPTGKTTKFQ